ncbi:MAG: AbrB/MazE/SpoVT family DNA-binding domain-containing protein [Caldilinea sp.]|jgi:AbrB family looped-hinge helix DNA binding protein
MYNNVMQTESMTFGDGTMAISQKYSRVQKKGQVTIPAEMRDKLGLKEGDLVAFIETDDGILISPQEMLAMHALDRIGAALKEQGISLDELIESGREERSKIIKEKYNLSEEI